MIASEIIEESLHAERAVLGSVFLTGGACMPVLQQVTPEMFSDPYHRAFFGAMRRLWDDKQPIDLVTMADAAPNSEDLPDSLFRMATISGGAISEANVSTYADMLLRQYRHRMLRDTAAAAFFGSSDDTANGDAILADTVNKLATIAAIGSSSKFATMHSLLRDEVQAMDDRRIHGVLAGLPTGFAPLDNLLGGMQPGGVTVIAARPSMGKSALATNILANLVLEQGKHGLLFSLEMTEQEQCQRLIASECRIDLNHIRTGHLRSDEYQRLSTGLERLSTKRLVIYDRPNLSVTEMRAKALELNAKDPLDVVIVDYLQLMVGHGHNREQEVASISRGLKSLAMELRIPVIALSQLNRAVESRQNHEPMLSDLRESGSIEQDATQVLLIYRDEFYSPETDRRGVADVIIAKNRHGRTGTVELLWQGSYTKFVAVGQG